MTLSVGMITVDTTDPVHLGHWWADQMGGQVVAENEGFFVVVAFEGAASLGFQQVENPTRGKNRIHLDLIATDVDAEVSRLVGAGATKIGDREIPGGGFSWVTLADPDGNEFCVAQHDH